MGDRVDTARCGCGFYDNGDRTQSLIHDKDCAERPAPKKVAPTVKKIGKAKS